MKISKMSTYGLALLFMAGVFLGFAASVQAATGYEVSGVGFMPGVTAQQFVSLNKLNEDLTIYWTAPASDALVMNYLLKFNTSNVPLTDQQFNDTANDFSVPRTQLFKVIVKSFFDTYDSDQIRYLHIKTQYVPNVYSDDVVIGPIRIDNVAPTGTLTLNPTSGSTTQIDVTPSPSEAVRTYWLSASSTFPGGAGNDFTLFPTASFGLPTGTAFGAVPIYGWFEDLAGNRSIAASASATYNYTSPVSINCPSSTIAAGDSMVCTVDGATAYNWTITDRSPDTVAAFSGGGTGPLSATSVTIVGQNEGTFTITATPATGAPLITGTITVTAAPYKLGDCNGDGVVDVSDVIKIVRASLDLTNAQPYIVAAADINKDGVVDVSDVIKAVRLSLDLPI